MGRRTRRRMAAAPPSAPAPRKPGPAARPAPRKSPRARAPERPQPPWAPFPLVELAILVALVLIVVGFFTHGSRGRIMLASGLGLASLATLEQTIREHFAGYRSHASLLAGAGAVGVAALLYTFTRLAQPFALLIALAVFGTLFSLLRAAHARAST